METNCDLFPIIRNTFLFRQVPEEAIDWAITNATAETVQRGEALFTPGQFSHSLGLVLSGRLKVTRENLFVDILEPGDWFGAAALFNQREEYPSTLTALSECSVMLLPQTAVEALMERWPRASLNYIQYLSGRICFLSDRVNSLAAGTAEGKVEQFLLQSADENGVATVSAAAMAKALGIGRASVYRAFERLEERGVISRSGKQIILTGSKT